MTPATTRTLTATAVETSTSAGPRRPRVLILVDVPRWAWDRKARHLSRWLADSFDIAVWTLSTQGDPPPGFDLYHTFEFNQVDRIPPRARLVTGITAHVWRTWGEDKVRKWASRAVAVHANSRLLLDEMVPFHPALFYVPNGVDPVEFRRTRPRTVTDRLIVTHVGKPNPRKGSHIIAEACKQAGVELRLLQRRSGDAIGVDEMREWYQDAHVVAVASDMDGTPNPALEGAACEATIVSNAIGNMPEFIEHGSNGFLVGRDAHSIASALRLLSADLERAESMGRAARATVEREWTWQKQSAHYRALWTRALEEVPRP